MARSYWLDLFTGTTWEEFLAAGGEVSGFRERRWKTVQQMKPGDYLLCYLTGISRWIGVLEVLSEPFKDTTPIWKDEAFPARVRVRPVATLSPETAVPVFELRDELTVFRDLLAYFATVPATATPFPELTAREHEVLDLLAAGQTNRQIADQLGLSAKTVANHISAIFAKLQVADRTQAILRARDAGLGHP